MNERIKQLRKCLGLTLEKFGERLGVGKSVLSQIENGRSSLTDQMFKSICREFSVNEEWLRDGTGEMFIIPDDEDAALISELIENPDNRFYQALLHILKTYQQLSPQSQEVLDDFIVKLLKSDKD